MSGTIRTHTGSEDRWRWGSPNGPGTLRGPADPDLRVVFEMIQRHMRQMQRA
jgi:hypothetical protein